MNHPFDKEAIEAGWNYLVSYPDVNDFGKAIQAAWDSMVSRDMFTYIPPTKSFAAFGNTGDYYITKPPSGRDVLGYKVISGTLIVFAGFYFFGYACLQSRKVGVDAGLKYLLLSVSCILAGALTCINGFLGL